MTAISPCPVFRWITAQPPGLSDEGLLRAVSPLTDSYIDLRYGTLEANRELLGRACLIDIQNHYLRLGTLQDVARYEDALPKGSSLIFGREDLHGSSHEWIVGLTDRGFKVGYEIGSLKEAKLASLAGAGFVLISGNETYGPVSDKTTLILAQEVIPSTLLPVIVRGSVGPHAAAALSILGAAGVILDSPLLLAEDSPLDRAMREQVRNLAPTDSLILGYGLPERFRMSGRPGLKSWKEMKKSELDLLSEATAEGHAGKAIEGLYWANCKDGFAHGSPGLLPVGQGVAFAERMATQFQKAAGIVRHYESIRCASYSSIKDSFPFAEGTALAKSHQTRFPIVQGPMANVSDNPDFARVVSREGALPFMAMSSMAPGKVRKMIRATAQAMDGDFFGVGLIGFTTSPVYEDHVQVILEEKPPFVTVAGGNAGLSRRFAEAGLRTYLHAPTPHHVTSFLEEGVKGLIFEGHEAGGHIGALGSAVLWELGVDAVLQAIEVDGSRTPEGILFAGGIAHYTMVMMAAVIAAPLVRKGIPVGIQLGTAYLSTEEIVDTEAVQPAYRSQVLAGSKTLSFGHSINMPTRCVESPFPADLLTRERELEKDPSVSLNERKNRIEVENRGHLRLAAKGIRRSQSNEPGYESVTEEEQAEEGAYHAGQCISQLGHKRTVRELHAFLLTNAERMAAASEYQPAWQSPVENQTEFDEDTIAIVGLSCRVPGANDCETFWQNVLGGESFIGKLDPDRYDLDLYFNDPQDPSLRFSTLLGGFMDPIEPASKRYKIPPNVADSIDPIQWLALELVEQALGNGKMKPEDLPQEKTAVIFGNTGGGEWSYGYRLAAAIPVITGGLEASPEFSRLPDETKAAIKKALTDQIKDRSPPIEQDSWYVGQLPTIIAGRVANAYNLKGGCSVVDAACASGLSAVELAMDGLRKGKIDAALVGAAETRMDPGTFIGFSAMGALSEHGCFPFDQRADGTVLGEGGGLVILKRLSDAQRDGNVIFGLIRGVGSSTDGNGKGLTAPNEEGQFHAIRRAYESSSVDPASIGYIEAHGTATPLGDESELRSTSKFLSEYGVGAGECLFGSLKAQVGHLRAASGMVGLIKATLALYHKSLPPNARCETPTDAVDWNKSPLYLLNQPKTWEKPEGPRRAGVSAFGFGGVNYHVVLEEPPQQADTASTPSGGTRVDSAEAFPAELFIFSAPDRQNLIRSLEEELTKIPAINNADGLFSYSLDCYRKAKFDEPVLTIVADSVEGLTKRLGDGIKLLKTDPGDEFQVASGIAYSESKDDGKVAFLCPGQGAHFIGMGSELAYFFPQVRPIFETVDAHFTSATGESLLEIMWVPEGKASPRPVSIPDPTDPRAADLARTDRSQPAIVAVSVAVAELLDLAGLRPEMAAGHSLGEYTACFLAGAIDLETLVYLVTGRGSAMNSHNDGQGAMAAISAPVPEIEAVLEKIEGYVIIANHNCPAQSTISGEESAVKEACTLIQERGFDALILPVNVAFHTKMVDPISEKIYGMRDSVNVGSLDFPIQSNVTGDFYPEDRPFHQSFWKLISEHAASPVRFMENLESLYQAGARTFIELGPGSALTGFTQATLNKQPLTAGSCMLRKGSQVTQFLRMIGILASKGRKPNLERLFAHRIAAQESRAMVRPVHREKKPVLSPDQTALKAPAWLPKIDGVSQEAFEQYLAQRGDYLKEMMQGLMETDFRHFNQKQVSNPGETRMPAGIHESALEAELRDSSLVEKTKAIFSARTGYPAEELDLELDLEADLGIDSIKQTEILQEIRESFGLDHGFTVGRSAITLADWIDHISKALPGQNQGSAEVSPDLRHSDIAQKVLEIFSSKTGYGIDDLDISLDLEADLGIDSIKQTEINQQIREVLRLTEDHLTIPRDAVSIADWIRLVEQSVQPETDTEEKAQGEEEDRLAQLPAPKTNVRAWVADLIPSPLEKSEEPELEGKTVFLIGGVDSATRRQLREGLISLGANLILPDEGKVGRLDQLPHFIIDLGRGEPMAGEAWSGPESWWADFEPQLKMRYALAHALVSLGSRQHDCSILTVALPGDDVAMALQGFYRCFRHEHASLNLKILQFKAGASFEKLPETIIGELSPVIGFTEVVYTREGRQLEKWTEKMDPVDPIPLTSSLRDDAVILSIGGGRGVTATLTDALIGELKNPTVVITGRDAEEDSNEVPPTLSLEDLKQEILEDHQSRNATIPPAKLLKAAWRELFRRERAARIRSYSGKGVEVIYRQLDVVDQKAVKELIQSCESRFGRIDLVIHGAAILIERQLATMRYEDYLEVVKVRGLGTANLAASLADLVHKPIIVNLGTGGARFGSPGLTAYGSGHQLAAGLLEEWGRNFSAPTKTLVFGPWLEIGMTRQGNSAERFRKRGVDFVTSERGSSFFLNELKSWDQTEVVLRGKPKSVFGHANNTVDHPMIDTWERVEDQRIEARGRFGPERNRWIQRHRIAGEPYFPGVYSLELMVATASLFKPDLKLKAVSGISWSQPLRFPNGRERELCVSAEIISGSDNSLICRCSVYTILPLNQERRYHVEGVVELGMAGDLHDSTLPVVREGTELTEPIQAPEMYSFLEQNCDHPDRNNEYQSISAIDAIGKLGISTAIQGGDDNELRGRLHIKDGVMLDASLHSQFPWHMFFGARSSSMPLMADRLEFFGDLDWDRNAKCRTVILEIHSDQVVSDIELLDSNGKVMVRWSRYTCHIIDSARNPNGKAIQAFVENHGPISRKGEWALALGVEKLEITRVGFQATEAFVAQFQTELSNKENDQLENFSAVNRRAEFVAGRIAAKASWLQFRNRPSDDFLHSRLSVISSRGKPPFVESNGELVQGLFLSISHSGNQVLAAVCDQKIGIDLQEVSDSIERIRDSFTNDHEVALLDRVLEKATFPQKLTAIWAAKEAVMKVCSTDIQILSVNLKNVARSEDWFRMTFTHQDEGEFNVIAAVSDEEVIAMTCRSVTSGNLDGVSRNHDLAQEALRKVEDACEAELGCRPQSKDEDLFFDLGCTSINAAQIIHSLESGFGIRMPLNLLLSHSTVGEIADLVCEKADSLSVEVAPNPAPPKNSAKATPILFWAQWSGPNFVRKYLPESQRAHFFKGHWFDESMDHLVDMESTVAAYIDELRQIQPEGPYVLGGYCFGGILAYEIARALQQSGETVLHLFLLDPYLPYSAIPLAGNFSESEIKAIQVALKKSYAPGEVEEEEESISLKRIIKYSKFRLSQAKIAKKLRTMESTGETLPVELRAQKVLRLYAEMIGNFTMTPYHGPATVIACKKRPEVYRKLWQKLISKSDLRFVLTDCKDHHSITTESEIGIWVNELVGIFNDG